MSDVKRLAMTRGIAAAALKRNSPPRHPMRRRAFITTITAVALIGLVSVVLTAIVAATIADVRRTRRLETDAQLRQLLQAGAADAMARAGTWGDVPNPKSWELTLPQALAQRGFRVELSIAPAQTDAGEVHVAAAGPAARSVQTLHFARSAGQWKLKDAGGPLRDDSRRVQ